MKKLKLSIYLSVFTLLFSCSNDDNENSNNSIIGTWKTTQEIFVDEMGERTTSSRNTCEQTGRTTFSENEDYTDTGYYLGNECTLDWSNTGNWEIINNNTIRITLNGQVDDGYIGDYLIIENTSNILKIDADLDPNSIEQEIYVLEKVN